MKIIGSLNNAWCTAGASGEVMSGDLLNKIGIDGRSAYEVAVANGFEGSEAEWLESLREPAVEAAVVAEEAVDQMNQKVVEVESVIEQVAAKLTSAEEVLEDKEGVSIMRAIGSNMAWLLKLLASAKGGELEKPVIIPKVKTNFILLQNHYLP